MELLKIQMQMAQKDIMRAKPSARLLAWKLFREQGIFGLYKGIGATYIRNVYFSMVFFPLFNYFNEKVRDNNFQ